MANRFLNTLFVQRHGAHVRLDHDTLKVEADGERLLQIPLQHLGGVVLFGNCTMSPPAMHRCVSENREVTYMDFAGRFRCRVIGPTSGNVLLRLAQFDIHRNDDRRLFLARAFARAKIANSRNTLLRGARDARSPASKERLSASAERLASALAALPAARSLDEVRGREGEAAREYFASFPDLLTVDKSDFAFAVRTRRPPRDRVNAALSFVYALVVNDAVAALEGVGLDPQVGMLHGVRPGRASLALDLAEEFRSCLADRLVLTLINRRQLKVGHFDVRDGAGGSVTLNEEGRKLVLTAFQERKAAPIRHSFLKSAVPFGLVPHLQARLLARHMRAELDYYPPFVYA